MPKVSTIKIKNTENYVGFTGPLQRGELAVDLKNLVLYVGNTIQEAVPLMGKDYLIYSRRYETTTTGVTAAEGADFLEVIGSGGGGGGGSGGKSSGSINGAAGGAGGKGGRFVFSLSELGITKGSLFKVEIGKGGTGGIGVTTGAGKKGETGGSTYLKSNDESIIYMEFPGGEGGAAGFVSGSSSAINDHIRYFNNRIEGQGGRSFVFTTTVFQQGQGTGSKYGGGGGGGAGSQGNTNVFSSVGQGSDGGKANTYNTSFRVGGGGLGATVGQTQGGDGGTTEYGGHGGGGGSSFIASPAAGPGAAGGRGGTGGGGGGGGAAARSSTASVFSGAGGTGGDGYMILKWWTFINQTSNNICSLDP